MSTASLNGKPCARVEITIPPWGIPHADVVVNDGTVLTGAVTLKLADLTMLGVVAPHRGGVYRDRTSYRIIGGAGGWMKPLRAQEYRNDAGIKLAKVLGDSAALAGETMAPFLPPFDTMTVGTAWMRVAGAAALTLQLLSERAWYVEAADGLTYIGARASTTPVLDHALIDFDPEHDRIEIASDSIVAILPGATIDGLVAGTVKHVLDEETLRTHVWSAL